MIRRFLSSSAQETHRLAFEFASELRRGDVVALNGDLGTGKTQFVQGVAEYFRVNEPVTSPSFVLVNRYAGLDAAGRELLLNHIDLYRVKSQGELYDLGFEELLGADAVTLIEWASAYPALLPGGRIEVRLRHREGTDRRDIEIERLEETALAQ